MLTSFFFAVIPPPTRDPSIKATFESSKAIEEGERSIKFLLKNEFLHQFGLLHSSRSIVAREVPLTQSLQIETPVAPASLEDSSPKGPVVEISLVKCSGSLNGAGSTGKSVLPPVAEEEEILHREGKEPTEAIVEEPTIEEGVTDLGQMAGHEGDDASIFEGLSDLMVTPSELFKDTMTSKLTLPVAGATLSIPSTPATQELTSAIKASTTPTSQSGLWRVVYTTHTLRIFWLHALYIISILVKLLPS